DAVKWLKSYHLSYSRLYALTHRSTLNSSHAAVNRPFPGRGGWLADNRYQLVDASAVLAGELRSHPPSGTVPTRADAPSSDAARTSGSARSFSGYAFTALLPISYWSYRCKASRAACCIAPEDWLLSIKASNTLTASGFFTSPSMRM